LEGLGQRRGLNSASAKKSPRWTRRVNPGKIYREIDWPLLVMFGGLFVVIPASRRPW